MLYPRILLQVQFTAQSLGISEMALEELMGFSSFRGHIQLTSSSKDTGKNNLLLLSKDGRDQIFLYPTYFQQLVSEFKEL